MTDVARVHRIAHERYRRSTERVVDKVRRRLVDHGAFDAVHALDALSPIERLVLAEAEMSARC